ncbi:MAG: glycosyltransferase family 9 protein [Deltaproteobacteria bacterium]|jgi:heptosyltransferase-3|nr:glycosyltransferase family 9 protein [Deltaproteobacteria bacterium]
MSTKKSLLITLKHLGDTVTTTVVIPMLKRRYPGMEIHYLVNPESRALVEPHPDVSRVRVAPRKAGPGAFWGLVRELRAERYDFAFDFSEGDRSALISFLSGARRRFAYFTGRGYVLRNLISGKQAPSWKDNPERAVAECHADLARMAGCDGPVAPYASLGLSQEGKAEAEGFLHLHDPDGLPYAVCHFTARDPFRLWPAERCADCVAFLRERVGPVFLATSGEGGEARFVERIIEISGGQAVSTAGVSLSGLMALVAGARGAVGLDSLVMHVAGAFGVPVIGIFGPSRERNWAPKGPWVRCARMELDCRSCVKGGCLENGLVSRCLKEMDFATYLLPHLEEMLATDPPTRPWPPEAEAMRLALAPLARG